MRLWNVISPGIATTTEITYPLPTASHLKWKFYLAQNEMELKTHQWEKSRTAEWLPESIRWWNMNGGRVRFTWAKRQWSRRPIRATKQMQQILNYMSKRINYFAKQHIWRHFLKCRQRNGKSIENLRRLVKAWTSFCVIPGRNRAQAMRYERNQRYNIRFSFFFFA